VKKKGILDFRIIWAFLPFINKANLRLFLHCQTRIRVFYECTELNFLGSRKFRPNWAAEGKEKG
jgi:hypothetical protein